MGRVQGKIALITGGASGIGRGCAELLAKEGAVAIVTDIQDDKGADVVAGIKAAGGKAAYFRHDTTDEENWISIVGAIERDHKRLDILVNKAGIAIGAPSITDMTLADWRKQQAVNLDGVFLGIKHCLPAMRRAKNGGSIINMSSVAGLKGAPTLAAYCATKGGVRLFTKAVALECGNMKDGVRVNSVHPGLIETPIWLSIASMNPGVNAPPDLDAMSQLSVPLGVKGEPLDIANAVLWLASDESRYVTGAELVIDGGLSVR